MRELEGGHVGAGPSVIQPRLDDALDHRAVGKIEVLQGGYDAHYTPALYRGL